MAYWLVTNGYTGTAAVGVLIEAESDQAALKQAATVLEQQAESWNQRVAESIKHGIVAMLGEDYWSELSVKRVELPLLGEFSL